MRLAGPWNDAIERWKAYFDPRTYRTYERVKREHPVRAKDRAEGNRREVLIDVTRHTLDRDVGRIAYFVVSLFRWSGFRVCLRDRFRFLGTMERKLYKRLLLGHPFEVVPGPEAMNTGYWWVTDRAPREVPTGCERLLVLDYAHRVPGIGETILPYFFNPTVYEHLGGTDPARYRSETRPYRVFFAGTFNRKYERDTMPSRYGILSRGQVLESVRGRFPESALAVVRGYAELEALGTRAHGRIVLLSPEAPLLTVEQWLTVLGRSEVLLAAPGVSMPLSHNLWEAMALGTVPLLEYPRQLVPPLANGVEAFVFEGSVGLQASLERILALEPSAFAPMRERCLDYHRRHGTVASFLERIAAHDSRRVKVMVFPYETVRTR